MIERILFLLKKHNMTAKTLTELLHVGPSTITEWKKGKTKPSVDTIIHICQIFNVSTDYILLGKEYNEDTTPSLSKEHQLLLKEYNKLDFKGQNAVRTTVQQEAERIEAEEEIKRDQFYKGGA